MKFSAVILSALVAVASALKEPDYSKPPSGNPISRPGLQEQVQAGVSYTITWQPTSDGPVSLTLLRGPSQNIKPLSVIVESTANTGTFQWTPSLALEVDVTHYGLLIVDQKTGAYQWSTQFGIKGGATPPKSSISVSRTVIEPIPSSSAPSSSAPVSYSTHFPVTTITTTICTSSASAPYPTGTAPASSAGPTAPTTYRATPTPVPSSPPVFEGAAGRNTVGLGAALLAMAAVFAF
ncbi:hypothetical protein LOZ61_006190 [Ophidiomyces ophidiicola]|uniref:Uncharacterized protein n=1 Tax=Ophidiomyces ophidiicola TaxID=1387563 RepID=A0ACB8USF3_9EURO|nr:hypothetical protein LOZ61_006190 [Ophidiomyces ophidiicola]KAI1908255.1 hypothetical protein LOZ64_005629 [Ophidiomyces ophidiicola]KAI1923177.1 hypothetical protein LOZ60_005374 [Ophidiomyces ophidiicola]KAI1951303.1 hypothetical protein LOZ59_005681 [Ophidiomyces ophidiicola]KAI1968684.1 hypothetical protein LOZ56_004898 [Ophidiomyces ophidiicola]